MVAPVQLITTEEFERFIALPEHRDRLFELINGEIVEKTPTQEHGIIALNIGSAIRLYLRNNNIGQAAVEARHRPTGDRLNDRIPDVSFVAGNQPVERHGTANYLPDLCIEIQSPDDSPKKMSDTANFYLAHGAKMVWLIYTDQRLVEVLTADDRQLLFIEDILTGGNVLPDFEIAVSEIYSDL